MNLENWKKLTGAGGNNVIIIVIPGVDHLFLPAGNAANKNDLNSSNSGFSILALQTIEKWINAGFR
ncbi:hypothetical protein [Pedobacter westerhofensis]|uniref:hypothetical protein n=1 Tax=Pedobacter westerhofensis TaxID=425512 RepID=UPI001157620B|nr:hypothetical protein [Pedobacter westerhofensis]